MTIKINKVLQANAFNDPTKETIQKSISQLCSEVDSKGIIMPIFQRDLAWTTQKKVELFNFQLNGFAPVSPISMNRTGPKSLDMAHVALIDRSEIESVQEGKFSVIDGQQRISTNYQAYTDDESVREVVLDVTKGRFVDLKGKDIKKSQIPVGVLYNKGPKVYTEYIRTHPTLTEFDVSSLLGQIRTKFSNYFYTVNFAQDLSGEEQIEWFDVLNLAGSRVPEIQMKLTRLQIKGLDFYKEYANIFRDKLELVGFDHLFVQKNTEVSIPIAALNPAFEIILGRKHHSLNYSPIPSDTKEATISDMNINDLRKCFEMTLDGLDRALDFINDNSLSEPSRIDYITYLTGYFVYKKDTDLSDKSEQELIDWYNKTIFVNKSNSERREMFDYVLSI
ncbi:DUF262 domain-containing protein [Aquibacillus rhizosphaerae]|uniref:DUF262 domain-containing protein n=1 Tax=Aquibacillus rhizosphaerae TaxID=3051431 RepID=A0ABT7L9E6_9BACI|nr:DUF262 domain-containing protein [Aquibacillus sp. LR5S19]MDL4842488.1 DUF262 domain-containing protein [Aquibacillus sp. LR5S19]